MPKIQMVDLLSQYLRLKAEIDEAMSRCIGNSSFIKGSEVAGFENELASYLDVNHVVSCGNGTDALELALMAIGIQPGDEVIIPAFNFVAAAEVVAHLGARPVFADVDPQTFNISAGSIENCITSKTKAVIVVHLFGQGAAMRPIKALCDKHKLKLIEDNAQAIGANYQMESGTKMLGTIGDVATTSFFPSKNLGFMGDGGACYTNNKEIADQIRLIANHGQPKKYTHSIVGMNSRLDGIQAAILRVKLQHLDDFISRRQKAAASYREHLQGIEHITLPIIDPNSSHVFHQFTLCIENDRRDKLKEYLAKNDIPSMIYYPISLDAQPAYSHFQKNFPANPISESLSLRALSIPMHTELKNQQIEYIAGHIRKFFN